MHTAAGLLTTQFLAWVRDAPRSYPEAMAAWRTSCPRLSIWEDALSEGLVRIDGHGAGGMAAALVVLTPAGAARLVAAAQPSSASASGEAAPSRNAGTSRTGPSVAPGAMSSEITAVHPASPAVASSMASQ